MRRALIRPRSRPVVTVGTVHRPEPCIRVSLDRPSVPDRLFDADEADEAMAAAKEIAAQHGAGLRVAL